MDRWRKKQSGRPRLPEEVWQSATRLAQQWGVSQVARVLRLSYADLRRRVEERPAVAPPENQPAFVEWAWQNPTTAVRTGGFRAELEKGRLTLHLGENAGAVLAVVEAFWRQQT